MKLVWSIYGVITISCMLPFAYPYVKKLRALTCVDRNLQRTLKWEPKNKSKNLKLVEYRLEFRSLSVETYENLTCYADDNRTTEIKHVAEPWCKTSVRQLLPWTHLVFRLQAVFKRKNQTVLSRYALKPCRPIESNMSLTSPTMDIAKRKTAITIHAILPGELSNAIASVFEYDLDIRYYFCVHQADSECQEKEEKCNPFYNFPLLEPDTEYFVESWYSARGDTTHFITSTRNKTIARTLPDPFPTKSKIMLTTLLSVMFVVLILSAIITRTVLKMAKKWHRLIKGDLPKCLIETREELKSVQNAGATQSALSKTTDCDLNFPALSRMGNKLELVVDSEQDTNVINDVNQPGDDVVFSFETEPCSNTSTHKSPGAGSPPPYVKHREYSSHRKSHDSNAPSHDGNEVGYDIYTRKSGGGTSLLHEKQSHEMKISDLRAHETLSPKFVNASKEGYSCK